MADPEDDAPDDLAAGRLGIDDAADVGHGGEPVDPCFTRGDDSLVPTADRIANYSGYFFACKSNETVT